MSCSFETLADLKLAHHIKIVAITYTNVISTITQSDVIFISLTNNN